MSIKKKLYINFGAILAIVLAICIVNLISVAKEHSASEANAKGQELAKTYESIRYGVMQNHVFLLNFLLSGSEDYVQTLDKRINSLNEEIKTAESKADSDRQRAALAKLNDVEQDWNLSFAKPFIEKRRQVEQGNSTVGDLQIAYLNSDNASWLRTASDQLDDAERDNNQLVEQQRASSERAAQFAQYFSYFSILLIVGVCLSIAYNTARSITEPLNHLIGVARDISDSGDLEHEIDLNRKDEVGELARSFSRVVAYLKEMAAISEAIAGGDLSTEVKPRSKRDLLGLAFVRMTEGLGALVRGVRDSSSQVASASAQVANASEESARTSVQASSAIDEVTSTMHEMSINVQNMVRNTQTGASSVAETSASIDEMVASIQRVADTSKVLLDISNRSRQEVQNGITSMDKATDGLNRINNSIQTSAEIIDVLGQRADDIGKIIEVIDDLAEQTNLLALNAAIEAARAGEHGLGFAVVADEVRKLAEKSAQSTKEISELIQSIQKEARKAVENMDMSTDIVNEGLGLGNELGGALKKISHVVTEVYKFAQEIGAATTEQSHGSSQIARATTRLNEITREISSSVEEQASGTQAVVKAMQRMRDIVQQNTSGSTELAASAEQMSKMSRKLLDMMDRFKLELLEVTENDLARARRISAVAATATGARA